MPWYQSCFSGIFVLLLLVTIGCSEQRELSFESWPQAVASGQTGLGKWIPSNIPSTAKNIRAIYAIDSEFTQISFQLSAPLEPGSPAGCKLVLPSAVNLPNYTASWWPNFLRESAQPKAGAIYFSCEQSSYFAFTGNDGYYWHP